MAQSQFVAQPHAMAKPAWYGRWPSQAWTAERYVQGQRTLRDVTSVLQTKLQLKHDRTRLQHYASRFSWHIQVQNTDWKTYVLHTELALQRQWQGKWQLGWGDPLNSAGYRLARH